jgi:hypothetical protein
LEISVFLARSHRVEIWCWIDEFLGCSYNFNKASFSLCLSYEKEYCEIIQDRLEGTLFYKDYSTLAITYRYPLLSKHSLGELLNLILQWSWGSNISDVFWTDHETNSYCIKICQIWKRSLLDDLNFSFRLRYNFVTTTQISWQVGRKLSWENWGQLVNLKGFTDKQ